jgi:uncharacterized membrane protein
MIYRNLKTGRLVRLYEITSYKITRAPYVVEVDYYSNEQKEVSRDIVKVIGNSHNAIIDSKFYKEVAQD